MPDLATLLSGGRRPRAYVASPLGFSDATRGYYRDVFLPALGERFELADPWSLSAPGDAVLEIGRRNAAAIDGADLVVAHLDGQEVDSGTAAEIGYACARGLPVLAIRSDWRQAGEEGAVVNLQVEAFVVLSGGFIARSLEALLARLDELSG